MIPGQSGVQPTLVDLLETFKEHMKDILYMAMPGKIEAYDPSNQTCSVSIMARLVAGSNGQSVPFPVLVDVPVHQACGGTSGLNVPVTQGDPCLIIFADKDIDNWFATNSAQIPNTNRKHSISDGFAITGFRPKANRQTPPDYTAVQMFNGSTQVSLKNGKIALWNPTTNMLEILTAIMTLLTTIKGLQVDIPSLTETGSATVAMPNQSIFNTTSQAAIDDAVSSLQTKISALFYEGEIIVPPEGVIPPAGQVPPSGGMYVNRDRIRLLFPDGSVGQEYIRND